MPLFSENRSIVRCGMVAIFAEKAYRFLKQVIQMLILSIPIPLFKAEIYPKLNISEDWGLDFDESQ